MKPQKYLQSAFDKDSFNTFSSRQRGGQARAVGSVKKCCRITGAVLFASLLWTLLCWSGWQFVKADTIVGTVATGVGPTAIAVNSVTNKIYVANFTSGNVTVIDGSNNSTTTVAVGTSPLAVAVNSVTNKIYVANRDSNNVTVIDGTNNSTSTVAAGSSPNDVAVNSVTNKIYVLNGVSSNVTVIDGSGAATTTVAVGTGSGAVAVNSVTNKIYVANFSDNGTVTVIDGSDNSTSTIAVDINSRAVAVNSVTNKIYVVNGNFSGTVTVIDGTNNSTATVAVGTNPIALAINSGTNKIYVANFNSANVTVIDGTNNSTATAAAGTSPRTVAVNPGTNKIYVANFNSANVTVIDGTTNSTTNIATGMNPFPVAVNSVTNKIYVANFNSNNVTVIDGSASTPTPTPTPTPATLIVTTAADTNQGSCAPGACSLREAIVAAAPGDEIVFASPFFDSPQTITLTPIGMGGLGGLVINKSLTITGKGAQLLTVGRPAQTNHGSSNRIQIFNIGNSVTVNLTGMTISGGVFEFGGGIQTSSFAGTNTTISGCHITGNYAGQSGGGIRSDSPMTIINSTISNNISLSSDAGIASEGGGLTLTNSTISGNVSGSDTGGIGIARGTSVITSSTITDNGASLSGGTGGLSYAGSGSLTIRNTIISGNRNSSTNPDYDGNLRLSSQGYNLIGNPGTAAAFFNQPGDQVGVLIIPMLAALSLNGGPTPTHALLPGSPAIDKGSSFGLTTDQRGLMRPVDNPSIPPASGGDNSDIGAFEVQPDVTLAATVSGRVTTPDGRGLRNAAVKIIDQNNLVRTVTTSSFGFYSFDNVATGQSYTMRISSRLYRFTPRVVQVTGDLTDVDFVGLE